MMIDKMATPLRLVVCFLILCLDFCPSAVSSIPLDIPCSHASYVCGRPAVQPVFQRVVGGHEAVKGAWPWTVMLLEQGSQVCGGAIISERLIVTAAHCFEGVSNNASRWEVLAGRHDVRYAEQGEQKFKVEQIFMHEHYNIKTVENDIALLVVNPAIVFTSRLPAAVLPACLPPATLDVHTGQQCLLAGWGDTLGTGSAHTLNQVILPVISDNTCARADWYGSEFKPGTSFCAGYAAGGKDACQGDSGSPLVCKTGNQWYVQGISSWGYNCAEPKWPGIYSDVSKYTQWLQIKMANHAHCGSTVIG